ncbi:MAG TPA: protein-disulfide reductase DsbD domain-containing protein, partial [Burkholderiales bacterium]
MKRLLFLFLVAFCLPALAQLKLGNSTGELLEPEKAFRFSARSVDAGSVEVRFAIAEGYYMYRDRMRFEAQGARLGKPEFPPGIAHKDDFFGEQQIYRKDVRIRIPVQGEGAFDLKVTSQGCADIGVCYVPMESTAALRVAAGGGGSAVPSIFSASDLEVARLFQNSVPLVLAGFLVLGLLLAFTPCVLPMIPIL